MKTQFGLPFVIVVASILMAFTSSEKRIKEKDVPQIIRDYIKTKYKDFKKPRYYLEIINDTVYYEVELWNKKEKLSLRFLKDGTFYELEKAEKFENLPIIVKENISKALESKFTSFKILEVEYLNPHLAKEHEVQVKGTINGQEKYYQFVFDAEGKVIRFEEVVLVPISSMF